MEKDEDEEKEKEEKEEEEEKEDHYGTFGGEVTETLAGDLHAPNSDDE